MPVDAFQGGERDIICISTSRTSNSSASNFIDDPFRLNVALTRAKYHLVVVGKVPSSRNIISLSQIDVNIRAERSLEEGG